VLAGCIRYVAANEDMLTTLRKRTSYNACIIFIYRVTIILNSVSNIVLLNCDEAI